MAEFDNKQALAEGWAVSEVGAKGDMFRLERDDEAAVFLTDQDAWTFVVNKATGGSRYHIAALKFLQANDCADFELIETHAALLGVSNGVWHLFAQLQLEQLG